MTDNVKELFKAAQKNVGYKKATADIFNMAAMFKRHGIEDFEHGGVFPGQNEK